MKLDSRLIHLRIDVIERNLAEVKNILKLKRLTYRDELALKHALLECIEACIDIANHIIAANNFRRPQDYRDVFAVLEEEKIISKNLSSRLQEMAGFRNVLVHRYAHVDMKRVLKFAKEDTKDIENFAKRILLLLQNSRKK